MGFFEIVAIGASAGGIKAITSVLADMPEDFPAPIVIVQHLDPTYISSMAEILQRNCRMKVKDADNGEALTPGIVYIARPGKHLLVKDRKISLTTTAKVHFSRPSIDTLFISIANSFGDKSIGVILSGTGKDGSAGLKVIKDRGGIMIAQDEKTAESFGMPSVAIELGAVDYVLPIQDIGRVILALMSVPAV